MMISPMHCVLLNFCQVWAMTGRPAISSHNLSVPMRTPLPAATRRAAFIGRKLPRRFRSADAPDDAGFVQVVLGHLHFHAVTDGEPDEALAHLAGNGRQHLVLVVQ